MQRSSTEVGTLRKEVRKLTRAVDSLLINRDKILTPSDAEDLNNIKRILLYMLGESEPYQIPARFAGKQVRGKTEYVGPSLLQIEKGLAMPEGTAFERNSALLETARHMEVGDSILVQYSRLPLTSNMKRATGFKFSQRRVEDKLRIWRVE